MKKIYEQPMTEETVMSLVTMLSRSGNNEDEFSVYDEEPGEPGPGDGGEEPGWGDIW